MAIWVHVSFALTISALALWHEFRIERLAREAVPAPGPAAGRGSGIA